MKALVKYAEGPGNIEVRDVPEPIIEKDEVKVRIKVAGFCGTDAEIAAGMFKTTVPIILGHEGVGEVVEVGPAAANVKVGDRVILETSRNTCQNCFYCRTGNYHLCSQRKGAGYGTDGVFAEFAKAQGDKAHRLPAPISYEEAIIMEPTNTATRAATQIAEVRGGDSALITGAGPIGLGVLQVVKACGASKVIIVGRTNQMRLNAAKELGASYVLIAGQDNVGSIVSQVTASLEWIFSLNALAIPEHFWTD